jgi:hypothetical protein
MRWAEQHPRSLTQFSNSLLQLATLNEEVAGSCTYALPRKAGGRNVSIEGPSVRFAELVMHSWRNCSCAARITEESHEYVRAQGVFIDHETTTTKATEVVRRIVDSKGVRYSADMIMQTSNAACSIAGRDAILQGIPRVFWQNAWMRARKLAAGDARSLANKRVEALRQFAAYGIVEEDIFRVLEVAGVADITIEHLQTLSETLTAIHDGALTPEEAFAAPQPTPAPAAAGASPAPEPPTAAAGGRLRDKIRRRASAPTAPTASDAAHATVGTAPTGRSAAADAPSATAENPAPSGGALLNYGPRPAAGPDLWEPSPEEQEAIRQREIEDALNEMDDERRPQQ